jgi:hypothetical protein
MDAADRAGYRTLIRASLDEETVDTGPRGRLTRGSLAQPADKLFGL